MRNLKTLILLTVLVISLSSFSVGSGIEVISRDGNIYYSPDATRMIELTSTGMDIEPVLHPNGKWVYFVRAFKDIEKTYGDGILKHELWRMDIDGSNEKLLYEQTDSAIDTPEGYGYASIDNIRISPKGDRIYFEIAKWVTSNALMVMGADGEGIKELGPGNDTRIILSTRDTEKDYAGYIVTMQHRYFFFIGSYDWYWLYTPDWKEVGPLGADFEYFTEAWEIRYANDIGE